MVELDQKVTLVSKEGEKFKVSSKISNMSLLIGNMLEDNEDMEESIPLVQISSKHLKIVIEYCKHFNFSKTQTDIIAPLVSKNPQDFIKDDWERKFITKYSENELIELIGAANVMNIPALFELCCAMIARELKGANFN